jgi:hypothetical protein
LKLDVFACFQHVKESQRTSSQSASMASPQAHLQKSRGEGKIVQDALVSCGRVQNRWDAGVGLHSAWFLSVQDESLSFSALQRPEIQAGTGIVGHGTSPEMVGAGNNDLPSGPMAAPNPILFDLHLWAT